MKITSLFIILMLSSFLVVHSQVKVNAVVLDEKGAQIPYATVHNSSTNHAVITNDEGRFELVCHLNDVIVIRCLGYQEYKNTAEQLLLSGVAVLKDAVYDISEIVITPNIDLKSIVKRFRESITTNYPKKAAQISGVYKEYSLLENEYSTFFQCDMDILINNMTSRRRPTFKTKVYDFKSFRYSDDKMTRWHITPEYSYTLFWLNRYSFLWNYKKNQYRFMGYITYNASKLIKIDFHPRHPDRFVRQYTGTMYINMDTYALVFLHYEMINNEIYDQFSNIGSWQKKLIQEEIKIMFEYDNGYYYPVYVIYKSAGEMKMVGNDIPNHNDTVNVVFVYNFFTNSVRYNPKTFIEDDFSIGLLKSDRVLDRSDYKSNFVLETDQEKRLEKQYLEVNNNNKLYEIY